MPIRALMICLVGCIFYGFDYLVQVTPSVMTHQLMQHLDITPSGLGLLGAGFFITYAAMQLPAGLLLERFGARKALSLASALCSVGLFLFAHTQSFWVAFLARSIMGVTAAFSFISAIFLINRWASNTWFAPLTGVVQLTGAAGSILGLAPVAHMLQQGSWQQAINSIAWIALVLSLIFFILIRDGHPPRSTQTLSKDKPSLLTSLRYLNKQRRLLIIFFLGYCSWVPVSGFGALWGVSFLQQTLHTNTINASHLCDIFWLGLGLGSIAIGVFSEYIKSHKQSMMLCFSLGLLSSLSLLFNNHLNFYISAVCLFILGCSAGAQALSFSLLKTQVSPVFFSAMSGLNNMSAIIGGACSQIIIGYLIHLFSHQHSSLVSIRHALLFIPACMLAGLLTSIVGMPETYLGRTPKKVVA